MPLYENLGIDLLLDEMGDLVVSPTGDLALTPHGRTTLFQDVKHLLDTLPGDLFAHLSYGVGLARLFGEEDEGAHEDVVTRAISDALLMDSGVGPRIEQNSISVKRISNVDGRSPAFEVSFVPIGEDLTNQMNLVWDANFDGQTDMSQT